MVTWLPNCKRTFKDRRRNTSWTGECFTSSHVNKSNSLQRKRWRLNSWSASWLVEALSLIMIVTDDSTVSSCSSMCGLMLQEPKKKNVVKLHLWTKKAEKIQKSTLMIGSQDFKELHAGMDGLMMRLPIQLAGHSHGKMLQEWNLLLEFDKATFQKAASAIRKAFGPGSKVLAAQDSRHTSQHEGKAASSFICRLERTLAIIYGEDHPNSETRTIFLYGRLQKGLHHDLMHSPSVLGALTFKEMVIVVKNKEKCQSELEKRQQNLDPAI